MLSVIAQTPAASGQSRFADNGDGTITDGQTGLTWEKKVKLDGAVDYGNPRDADNYYPWAGTCSFTGNPCQPSRAASALCTAQTENGTAGCGLCGREGICDAPFTAWIFAVEANKAKLGGHDDWRLPKREELVSIVDFANPRFDPVTYAAFQGASCGADCADIANPACSCTQSSYYWSASSVAPQPSSAWHVYFFTGYVGYEDKIRNNHVRLVRGGS
jgi:hypothetical protein